jgi:hypothetical protein
MHRFPVFRICRVFHFMTGNTKIERVGIFNKSIEPSPEYYARQDSTGENGTDSMAV